MAGNHLPIFADAGLETAYYKYYKPSTKGLDLEGVLADVAAAPAKSVFLFHACAHNPTGVDPTPEQWAQISAAVKAKGHYVILDSAYQGFASGDPVKDTLALRQFAKDGHEFAVAQSFSKNFGLDFSSAPLGAKSSMQPLVCTLKPLKHCTCSATHSLFASLFLSAASFHPVRSVRTARRMLVDRHGEREGEEQCREPAEDHRTRHVRSKTAHFSFPVASFGFSFCSQSCLTHSASLLHASDLLQSSGIPTLQSTVRAS